MLALWPKQCVQAEIAQLRAAIRLGVSVRTPEIVMFRLVAAASVLLLVAACGDQSTAPAAPAIPAPADTAPTQPITATTPEAPAPAPPVPVVSTIVNVPDIAGRSKDEVANVLGDPVSCENVKQGTKCLFTPGDTEIVFISGKADWITVEGLDSAPYSEEVLPLLGIAKTRAALSSDYTMRWDDIPGFLEISFFPGQTGVDYAYIKTTTP